MTAAPPMAVAGHVEDYLAMRRALGYRMQRQARSLHEFACWLHARDQHGPVPVAAALEWAADTRSPDPRNPARRLSSVRGFLRYLSVLDGATVVPAVGTLGPTTVRTPPHIYSPGDIAVLLAATAALHPVDGLRPHAYRTLFGLLACTGLRISEALALACGDVDLPGGVLTIHAGKGGRSRLVPLHPTAAAALEDYQQDRADRFGSPPAHASFLRTDTRPRIGYEGAASTFDRLRRELGWTAAGRTRAPRIHDLRHTMVVHRITAWHADGADLGPRLPALATYLGHANIADTYWYFSAVPELMDLVADRFEHHPDMDQRS
jgi:integrase